MEEPTYLSYLLRLWMVEAADRNCWRASLESPITGERLGFQDLEALFTYLECVTQDPSALQPLPRERDEE